MPDTESESDSDRDPDALVPNGYDDVAAALGMVGTAVSVERPDGAEEPGILRAAYRPGEDVTRVLVDRTDAPLLDCSNDAVEVLK